MPLEGESGMLERFEVSRASLREALRILETQGLITIKPGRRAGRSASVGAVDSRDFGRMATLFLPGAAGRSPFGAVVEARLVIEPVMAELAAERHDPGLEGQLQEIIEAGHDIGAPRRRVAAGSAQAFHSDGLAACPATALLNLLARIPGRGQSTPSRVAGLRCFPPEKRDDVVKVHARIAGAIIDGDGATARRLMHDHMATLATFLERYPGLMSELVDWR